MTCWQIYELALSIPGMIRNGTPAEEGDQGKGAEGAGNILINPDPVDFQPEISLLLIRDEQPNLMNLARVGRG